MKSKSFFPFIVLFGILFVALALQGCSPPPVCGVTDYIVTKSDDTNDGVCDADCSLREAVINANACAGHQTIHLPADGYTLTLVGDGEDAAATGDLDITDDVTIIGTGVPSVHGLHSDRVFEIFSPAVAVIDHIIVIDGVEQLGAGIYNHSELTLIGLSIHHNEAIVPPGGVGTSAGGGIFNEAGTLILDNTQVFSNVADHGGGIHNFATANLVMNGGIISHNTANQNAGGLWVNAASMADLHDVTIQANTAAVSGGGIYNAGTLALREVEILENISDGIPGGGGIYNISPSDPVLGDAAINMQDCLIAENDGGGILNLGIVSMTTSTLRDNISSASLHPGIENGGEMIIDLSLISGNQVSGLVSGPTGVLTVTDTTITENTGGNGAGMIVAGVATIQRSTISNNIATFTGGGIESQGGNLQLFNVTISGNQAGNGGGIIRLGSPSDPMVYGTLVMSDSTVTSNQPNGLWDIHGGMTIKRSIVAGNVGDDCVGGVMLSDGYNLDGDGTCAFFSAGDLSAVSPLLGPLADNGGPTKTHALLPGSPALDAASVTCSATDQRGVIRPQGASCDMGAYEEDGSGAADSPDTPTPVPTATPTPEPIPLSINFNADLYLLEKGACTKLHWEVKNAESVFLDNELVDALGARQVCPVQTTTYVLLVISASGEEEAYVTIEVEILPEPPEAPGRLRVSDWVCDPKLYRATLEWFDLADNESGYKVYRNGELLATLPANSTSYVDNPPFGGPYTYDVVAFNDGGVSPKASVVVKSCND